MGQSAKIHRKMTVEKAAAVMLGEILVGIDQGLQRTLDTDDPEGPHMLRISLRRYRTVLKLFHKELAAPETTRIAEMARTIARDLGQLRDLEVVVSALCGHAGAPRDPAESALIETLEASARSERIALRARLSSLAMQQDFSALREFPAMRGWLIPEDIDQTERLARRLEKAGAAHLDRAWRKASKAARGIDALDAEGRHVLRKMLKHLRYSVEFLTAIFDAKVSGGFEKKLRSLLASLGTLNDAAVLQRILNERAASKSRDGALQAVAAGLSEVAERAAEASWSKSTSLWKKLARSRKPWK